MICIIYPENRRTATEYEDAGDDKEEEEAGKADADYGDAGEYCW